jgi:hypothetical protein
MSSLPHVPLKSFLINYSKVVFLTILLFTFSILACFTMCQDESHGAMVYLVTIKLHRSSGREVEGVVHTWYAITTRKTFDSIRSTNTWRALAVFVSFTALQWTCHRLGITLQPSFTIKMEDERHNAELFGPNFPFPPDYCNNACAKF